MGANLPCGEFSCKWPSKKLGHCIHPRFPEIPMPTVSAKMIQPDEYRRVWRRLGSRAMNHQAAPQVTPAKTQPFIAPNPEQPRTAQVIPPNAIKRTVGRIKSCARSAKGSAVRSSDKSAKGMVSWLVFEDWGGVVLMGSAPISLPACCAASLKGRTEPHARFPKSVRSWTVPIPWRFWNEREELGSAPNRRKVCALHCKIPVTFVLPRW